LDIFTQGLLGAALAQTCAPPDQARQATVIGFAAGLLPDADALLRSSADPLFFLEFHRHFSHALVFVPAGALLAALVLRPLFRRLEFARIYLYSLLGYCLAGLLDACTSYGTHLWWPFSDERVAWNLLSIVDPIFSLLLLGGVIVALWRRQAVAAMVGLSLSLTYVGVAFVQHERALQLARVVAQQRGHTPAVILVKPTFGNIVLWRSLYEYGGQLHADGIRPGLLGPDRAYTGESLPLVAGAVASGWSAAHQVAEQDLRRFAYFAANMLVVHPSQPDRLGDARFALLPTSLKPLWAIQPDPALRSSGGASVKFVTSRSLSETDRNKFITMLSGTD
jgi:inner membrane protein